MRGTRHLHHVPMRAEDVLACIRDSYRFAEELDPESEPGVDLTFESTIDEWRSACDLLGARELGRALNGWFGVEVDDTDWRAVLEPAKQRRLREVCELVSGSGATRPALRPFQIAGRDCLEAGAFLTLRAALSDAGVLPADARPSTALSSVVSHRLSDLVTVVGKVAPGVLPVPPWPITRAEDLGMKLAIASVLLMLLIPIVKAWWYSGFTSVLMFAGIACFRWAGRQPGPPLDFGDLHTFGDLSRRIAAHGRVQTI